MTPRVDLDATLERLAEQGIEPEKPPYSVREGGSRLCLVRDPECAVREETQGQAPRASITLPAWRAHSRA
jgi:hypothetical protein